MSKDRLEDIKQAYGYGCDLPEDTYPFWLIERVQELELEVERANNKANHFKKEQSEQVDELKDVIRHNFKNHKHQQEIIFGLEQQIERYQEAFKQIRTIPDDVNSDYEYLEHILNVVVKLEESE